jgi:hypothetical protein
MGYYRLKGATKYQVLQSTGYYKVPGTPEYTMSNSTGRSRVHTWVLKSMVLGITRVPSRWLALRYRYAVQFAGKECRSKSQYVNKVNE